MKEQLKSFAASLGLEQFGVCETAPGVQALVFLFPYFASEPPGRISVYARGADYHSVSKEYLLKICGFVKSETGMDFSQNIYCDISPYNDREIAYKAGLGFFGKNTLLINPLLGSYFFIGYILTSGLNLPNDTPLSMSCMGCNACESACPGNAISDNGVNICCCASDISQKKGELSTHEQKILLKSGYIWGCDICQQICPHNANLKSTLLPEFAENRIFDLASTDISALSEKQFRQKYAGRAFIWRGKKPLLRNLKLFENFNIAEVDK